jgi:hypothetical protein
MLDLLKSSLAEIEYLPIKKSGRELNPCMNSLEFSPKFGIYSFFEEKKFIVINGQKNGIDLSLMKSFAALFIFLEFLIELNIVELNALIIESALMEIVTYRRVAYIVDQSVVSYYIP